MKIICDTNIWYNIGNQKIDISSFVNKDRIFIATISILELAITENNLNMPEYTQKAIQSMIKISGKNTIVDPPIHHIIKLAFPSHTYDQKTIKSILEFTERIADGAFVDKSNMEEYQKICDAKRTELISITDFTNQMALQIKQTIKNKEQHRNRDSSSLCKLLIAELVFLHSGKELPVDFDWSKLELFIAAFDAYLKKIETGAKVSKENDWYDLFLCVYVQPGMKIWTKERYWLAHIKEIGMEEYLFEF